jgi:hypothetical protein
MKGRTNNNSKLFLTELMISIFFFAVIAAVCTQIFSEAHTMSRQAGELTGGVNAAANVAEYFEVWDGTESSWQTAFPEGVWAEQEIWYQAYDDQWQPVAAAGTYVTVMQVKVSDGMAQAQITVKPYDEATDAQVIYELDVERLMWK